MSKRKWIAFVALVVAASGTGAWYMVRGGGDDGPPYRLGTLALGDVESTVTSTGTLQALQTVAIGTQVSGQVISLYADYNDRVTQGQLLARIDPTIQEQQVRNAEASLQRVRAALVQAEQEYDRNKRLYDQQVITEAEFSQVEYNLTVARSNLTSSEVSLEQARRNLDYTEIYSPIDGIVVERNVEPGQTVAASLSAPQLYLIASDLVKMEILASVDESDIGLIRTGMPVRFTVQAYPEDTFEGVVRQVRLSSATQESVVNYMAVISVDNPRGRLLPGMTATVDFIVERAENVYTVPNAALRLRPTEEMLAQLTDSISLALVNGPAGGVGAAFRAGGSAATGPGGSGLSGGQRIQLPGGLNPGDLNPEALEAIRQGLANGQRPAGALGGRMGVRSGADPAPEEAAAGSQNPDVFEPGGGSAVRPQRISFSNLWVVKDGKLSVMRVQTGVSDGTSTEISADGLEPGMEIVVGLTQPQIAGSTTTTTNPFQQQGFRGGGAVFIGPGGGFAPAGGAVRR